MSVTFVADLQLTCDEPEGHEDWRLHSDYSDGGGTASFIENTKRACSREARKAGWLLLPENQCRCPKHKPKKEVRCRMKSSPRRQPKRLGAEV